MRRSLAEAYEIPHLCPMCDYIGSKQSVIDHMVDGHTDEEMVDCTGWNLDDYPEDKVAKLKCKLVGTDGNVFSIMCRVQATLEEAGQQDKAKEFMDRAEQCDDYDAVLRLVQKYVDTE